MTSQSPGEASDEWDMAAGLLLVSEAGGAVSDMHGNPASLRGPHVLTDNGKIHSEVLRSFEEIFAGQFRVPLPQMSGR